MDAKHSPLPWSLSGDCLMGQDKMCIKIVSPWIEGAWEGDAETKANMAYILKAANAYPKLVEALKAMLRQVNTIEVLGEYEAQDINFSSRKKMRAQVDEVVNQAIAALESAK